MTTAWDRYVKKELRKPAVKKAYETHNPLVRGSNPCRPTNISPYNERVTRETASTIGRPFSFGACFGACSVRQCLLGALDALTRML
jgi:hypothetical protein